ncbi:hypothetical protein DDB_G0286325 [Dictyostelium discoideum AX4]|uniref:Isopenicillin N synthase-like Fe(2+) 2OG dioxygenase domain-containing protein n=1 Tax=Dictyostelium discoideum TaxID=44689 RepID=Q54M53_DICDI|nr:hypothetical protein DDB_G0286325 [Dictyostelium discoideum AX4]EAL64338.1 hypothetical protein DDB_G0286325 [Dictyostelium discoideum AX4]|eukprot:XP_637778.1 hypothetical protein DDB_G0286325 [Dictyostelium discoideum AX4]
MSFDDDDDDDDDKITKFDDVGGLQAFSKSTGNWINVKPICGSFVFNIGDMLEIITKGYYTSMFHQKQQQQHQQQKLEIMKKIQIIPINNLETTPTTTTKIGNYEKDPNILNFKGTYK